MSRFLPQPPKGGGKGGKGGKGKGGKGGAESAVPIPKNRLRKSLEHSNTILKIIHQHEIQLEYPCEEVLFHLPTKVGKRVVAKDSWHGTGPEEFGVCILVDAFLGKRWKKTLLISGHWVGSN